MQLETIDNNKQTYSYIRDGVAGNKQTVYRMIALVANTVDYDRGFNDLVNRLLLENGLDAYSNPQQKLSLVYSFIRNHVTYLPDKAGKTESIKSARETLKDGYGDCDDLSILAASMLGVMGFEDTNFVLATYTTGELHIYVETFAGQKLKRFVLDLSLPQDKAKLNYEIKPQTKQVFSIFKQDALSSLLGSLFNIKIAAKQVSKQTLGAIPYTLQFLPLGLIPANLVQQGVNLITQSDINSLSLNELGSQINSELDDLINLIQTRQIADDFVIPYAMQITSQLSAYDVQDEERDSFAVIKTSIKNKLNYIKNLLNEKDDCITLNPKGMLVAGAVTLGVIGYQLYKRGKF